MLDLAPRHLTIFFVSVDMNLSMLTIIVGHCAVLTYALAALEARSTGPVAKGSTSGGTAPRPAV